MSEIRLGAVGLDCADPSALAEFWSALLGGRTTYVSAGFVSVATGSVRLTMHGVDGYRPPSWPGGPIPKQMHLDVEVDDLQVAVERAVRLGAQLVEEQPAPDRWTVLLDPAGHPFCLTTLFPRVDR